MKPLLNSELNVSQALAMTGVFPPMVIQLWATGEQSGKMDEMLDGLVRNFEAQWQQSLRILSVVLPIVIYFLIGIYLITQIFGMFGEYINGINTAIDGGM
jgi:type II secretory pathway component PulF